MDSAIDELIGLCRGVIGDGAVTESEAGLLVRWMEANREAAGLWPANQLFVRLEAMLRDGVLDLEEQGDLLDLLQSITGPGLPLAERARSFSATLPLSHPPPRIIFAHERFCLTGRFAFGSRKNCETAVVDRGGIAQSEPTRETSFLVIGVLGSSDWMHSTYGRKIEYAVTLREKGVPIAIVAEEHWVRALATGAVNPGGSSGSQ